MFKEIKCQPNEAVKGQVKVYLVFESQMDFELIRSHRQELKDMFKGDIKEIYVPKEEGKFELLVVADKKAVGPLVDIMYEVEETTIEVAAKICRVYAIPFDGDTFDKLFSIFKHGGKKNEDNTY